VVGIPMISAVWQNEPVLSLAGGKLLVAMDGETGWLTFNNPERRNAISVSVWRAIPEALDFLEAEAAVRIIALTGAGDKAFISGLDISEFDRALGPNSAVSDFEALVGEASRRLRNTPKPTLAVVRGYCVGAGVQVIGDCDLCMAADDARFAITVAKMGLGYPAHSLKHLCDLVGVRRAKDLLFTGRLFSADDALAMGLVNIVVPAAEIDLKAREYSATIAANAPLTIRGLKRGIATMASAPSDESLRLIEELNATCIASADFSEGRKAFFEKRKPAFKGR
jgi:enoyl-CoA hydratase